MNKYVIDQIETDELIKIRNKYESIKNENDRIKYLISLANKGIILSFADYMLGICCINNIDYISYDDYLKICLKYIKNKSLRNRIIHLMNDYEKNYKI